jgi:flagellar capping protein FliD
MQNQKSLVVAVVVIGLFIIAAFLISKGMDKTPEEVVVVQTGTTQVLTGQTLTQTQRETIASTYIKAKISELSPKLPVLGGTFEVTDISFTGPSQGEVKYEDGHVAFTADFNYIVNDATVAQ